MGVNMGRYVYVALCVSAWSLFAASTVLANGFYQSVTGDVRAAVGTGAPVAVSRDTRFQPGTTLTTGPNSQTIMRFDDGQAVVLSQNSEFRVNQYTFSRER